jgi:Ca2+-binding EF-hand superfamily protein
MSDADKDAAKRVREKERFARTLEKAELSQAQQYLRAQHKIADGALRETSQSVFAAAGGRKGREGRISKGALRGEGAGGVIYGGAQVYKPANPLRVAGSRATLSRRGGGEEARRIDFLESRLRRLIEDAATDEAGLRALFRRLDRDNSGKLSRVEMRKGLLEIGVTASSNEVQELIDGLDHSEDGLCSYDEFVRIAFPTGDFGDGTGKAPRAAPEASALVTLLSEKLRAMIEKVYRNESELRRLFSRFDRNRTGRVTRSEFQRAFAELGLVAPAKEVQQLIDSLDTSGDGMVSYGEFVSAVHGGGGRSLRAGGAGTGRWPAFSDRLSHVIRQLADNRKWDRQSLRRIFEDFDRDRSGFITRSEFKRGFDELRVRCDETDLDELMRAIDTNRDGRISYSEFVDVVYNNNGGSSGGSGSRPLGRGASASLSSGPSASNTDILDAALRDMIRDASWHSESKLRDLFREFDRDDSGRITRAQFRKAFARMGLRASTVDVDRLVDRLDKDNSGDISYREFVTAATGGASSSSSSSYSSGRRLRGSALRNMMRDAIRDASWTRARLDDLFLRFDKNDSGRISASEFRDVFKKELRLGRSVTDKDIYNLVDEMDTNGDGLVDYREFVEFAFGPGSASSSRGTRGGRGRNTELCLAFVDGDLRRQLKTDRPWGDERTLRDIFRRYDTNNDGYLSRNDLEAAIGDMSLRVNTTRFVDGLAKGLVQRSSSAYPSSSSTTTLSAPPIVDGTTRVPYEKFIMLMITRPSPALYPGSGMAGPAGALGGGAAGGMRGAGNQFTPLLSNSMSRRPLTQEEFRMEDIASATAAAHTVNAAADQMAMLRCENEKLRSELSAFDMSFFEQIEDLKFNYLVQVRRNDAMTRAIWDVCSRSGEDAAQIMLTVDEEAGREAEFERMGSQGRRERLAQAEQLRFSRQPGLRSVGATNNTALTNYSNNPGRMLANEWAVSDQWLQLVFDRADGGALAELERQCRLFDVTNTGMIAVPELRMALRATLATANAVAAVAAGVPMSNMMVVPPAPAASMGGLSPSAMVFGELVRRFESRQSRMGGPPGVDYAALLKAILNQGSRPSVASYLGDDVGRRRDDGRSRAGGRAVDRLDDEFMRMIREGRWDDRGKLEELFYRVDKVRGLE